MKKKSYEFKFTVFGNRVQMFHDSDMGIVVEKERDVVCVYGTNSSNSKILCAVPLCHPKYLKGMTYRISFYEDSIAAVSVGVVEIYIDFKSKKCANNMDVVNYGSEIWGEDVALKWDAAFEQRFCEG